MRLDIPKLIDTTEGQFHYCVSCEDYKPVSEFYKCPKCKSGYQYSCVTCHRVRWRELNPEPISDEQALEHILTKMGYDTNGDKTIHEQFVERVLERSGIDLTIPMKRKRNTKYKHLNPPHWGTNEYHNWYNKEIRKKK